MNRIPVYRGVRIHIALGLLPLLAACNGSQQSSPEGDHSSAVSPPPPANAAVLETYVARETGQNPADVAEDVRRQLTSDFDGLRAAADRGSAVPGAVARAELARLDALARAGAEAAGVFAAPSAEELRREYDRYLQSLPADEYRAAHILVATESLAFEAIAELAGGAQFVEVARKRSSDGSRNSGGELGWIRPGSLPDEIFSALSSLQLGEITTVPVRTSYGWHVLQLLDKRPANRPSLEQVASQLATTLQQERLRRFLQRGYPPAQSK